jgi:Ran GTPase-activating protein (RanGAP) involved in mRNA processing and transport
MNEINMFKFYPLLKYQIKSMIPKLENLTIITSSPYIFIIYDISILCPNLKSLSINYVSDERLADSNINISILCDTFPILFNSLKNLETLTLKNIPIVGQNLIDFKNSILNTNISKLCLNNSSISKQKFETLYPYFKGNLKLTELDLSNHNCNIPALLNMSLFSGENNIISLNLSQNNFDENDIKILSQIILNNPKLKSLNISKNKLTQLSCSTIGFALNKTKTLEVINMSDCDINGETLVFLFTSKGSNSFKKIILDYNNLGDIGLMMLSHFIKNSNNLETISLKKVNGTDMGLSPIVSISLISKSPLKCIYIEENIINENLINDIIKNSEKYNEKGTVFNISSSYFKKNNEKYKCINLV